VLVQSSVGVNQVGVGHQFEAILARPVSRLDQRERLWKNGREMHMVSGHGKTYPALDPFQTDGLAGDGPISRAWGRLALSARLIPSAVKILLPLARSRIGAGARTENVYRPSQE
jgi:hypothetical protein